MDDEASDTFSEDELRALARAKRVAQNVAARQPGGSHSANVANDCAASVDRLVKAVVPEQFWQWADFAREVEFE